MQLVERRQHWADDATLDFVRYLGRRIRESYAFECHLIGDLLEAIAAGCAARQLYRDRGDRIREGD